MIVIHVACDDEVFRNVVADFLEHQRDMHVVNASDTRPALLDRDERADVVVFGIPPQNSVTQHAYDYRGMAQSGAAIVVFCTNPDQAAEFENLGVEYLVDADDPARELAAAVRTAYRRRAGHTIH